MKIIDCEQGSIEWMVARLGMPTASQFDRILTPKTRKPSASRADYLAQTLGEWLIGQPKKWGTTAFMERGTDLEDDARKYYALQRDVDVVQVGFVTRDDGLVGCSPDGLLGLDGGLEIKILGLVGHVAAAMLENAPDFVGQVQGCMYLTEREWWDVIFYHPELSSAIVRSERDDAYIAALEPVLADFLDRLEQKKQERAHERVPRPWSEEPTP